MLEEVTFRRIERFLAVADTGSVRQAAGLFGISYQALSSDLALLERGLGIKLFDRVRGSGSAITTAGRLLAPRARQLLESGERLEEYAQNLREGRTGVVSIAAYPVHLERFLAMAIKEFSELHPRVGVDLSKVRDDRRRGVGKSLFEELTDGDVDIAMGPPHTDLVGVHGVKAYDARIVALFPPDDPLAGLTEVSIDELRGRDVLVAPRTYFSRETITSVALEAGFHLSVAHEGSSPPALRALGAAGLGIPLLPDDYTVIGSHPQAAYPVLLDVHGREVSTPVWVHWREGSDHITHVETFIDVVKDLAVRERRSPRCAAVPL